MDDFLLSLQSFHGGDLVQTGFLNRVTPDNVAGSFPVLGAVLYIVGCLQTFFGVHTSDNSSTLLSKS